MKATFNSVVLKSTVCSLPILKAIFYVTLLFLRVLYTYSSLLSGQDLEGNTGAAPMEIGTPILGEIILFSNFNGLATFAWSGFVILCEEDGPATRGSSSSL